MLELSPPEIALVRHLVAGWEPPESDADIDWERVLSCAGCHRLGPLLYDGTKRTSMVIPSSVATRLEKIYHVELGKAVVRGHHIEGLEAIAERSGRAMSLLKGAAFAEALYANPALRPMADVDILVHPSELPAWEADVAALGFQHYDASDHAICVRHRHTGVFVELHRSLTSCNRYLGLDTSAILERAERAGALRTLSPEDHLLHLCLHASFQHGFRQAAVNAHDSLLLVADPKFDATRFLERASTERLGLWVYGGLRLSHSVFPSPELARLAHALRDTVSPRVVRKLERLDAAAGLTADPTEAAGPPIRRLLWAGDIPSTLSLLIEVLRPRHGADLSKGSSWTERAAQLLWNHCLKIIPLALMKQAQTFLRPTPASLGEVRDV